MDAKREKFIDLANKRTNKAIKAIRLIGNLSNKTNYNYTKADVEQIFSVLSQEVKGCRRRFESPEAEAEFIFELK